MLAKMFMTGGFSISDGLPVLSTNARRAARQIVDACVRGNAEVVLSLPANRMRYMLSRKRSYNVAPARAAAIPTKAATPKAVSPRSLLGMIMGSLRAILGRAPGRRGAWTHMDS